MYLSMMKKIKVINTWLCLLLCLSWCSYFLLSVFVSDHTPPWTDYLLIGMWISFWIHYWLNYLIAKEEEKRKSLDKAIYFSALSILIILIKTGIF